MSVPNAGVYFPAPLTILSLLIMPEWGLRVTPALETLKMENTSAANPILIPPDILVLILSILIHLSLIPIMASSKSVEWLLLHVRILEVEKPFVWRQVLVPSDLSLDKLHLDLVTAFGWAETHCHSYEISPIKGRRFDNKIPNSVTNLNAQGFEIPTLTISENAIHTTHMDLTGMPMNFHMEKQMDDRVSGGIELMFPGMTLSPAMAAMFTPQFKEPKPKRVEDSLDKNLTIRGMARRYELATVIEHALIYIYDLGDFWEHLILIEKTIPPAEVRKMMLEQKSGFQWITAGSGHCLAEDAGNIPGWKEVKASYEVKGTPRDNGRAREKREWYENMCSNGDSEGLMGKERLEHFDIGEANRDLQAAFAAGMRSYTWVE